MSSTVWASIGVHLAPDDRYGPYFEEALEHAGLPFTLLPPKFAGELGHHHVLLLGGYGDAPDEAKQAIHAWVAKGGALVCCGSPWGLNDLLGLQSEGTHASNDVARPQKVDRLWPEAASHARFFGGTLFFPHGSDVVAVTDTGRSVVCRHKVGKGLAIFVAPHVAQTMAMMQMGRSVETDAVGPTDGSAVLDDGILRAEDGTNLFFESDRARAEGWPTPFFAHPHADVVREILVRAIMEAVDHTERAVIVTWPWPRMAPAAAMLTLDCEDLANEHVYRTHQLLSMHGCPATWMVCQPGYPLDVYRSFRAWEHEVGCLYATEPEAPWTDERLKLQHVSLTRAASVKSAFAARAQDGRWRGWDTFYDMCEVAGARLSVSKGGRQPGTVGFTFGTCHPFFPRRADGTQYLTAELPYTVYMPGQVTNDAVCDTILATTIARGGCFHMVCRPEATADALVSSSIRRLVTNCRMGKVEFMLPEQLWRFEKGRRTLRRVVNATDRESQLLLIPDVPLEGLTVMISGKPLSVEMRGHLAQVRPLERYGTRFTAVQLNLDQKQHVELRLRPMVEHAAA